MIYNGDFFKSEADLMVIPHSTDGLLDDASRKWLKERDLDGFIPVNVPIGHVQYLSVSEKQKPKYVAFACTIQNQNSSYTALRQCARSLIAEWPDTKLKTMALPVLGASGKNVIKEDCYRVVRQAMREVAPADYDIKFYTQVKEVYEDLSKLIPIESRTSALMVVGLLAKTLKTEHWVTELTERPDYYFQLAVDKFHEYLNFKAPGDFFTVLLADFKAENTTFSKYLETIPKNDQRSLFLKLCGELTAYIDKHAYRKKEWNLYPDKRTLAASAVNQTRWIEGLIKYRNNGGKFQDISASIMQAICYLSDPAANLTMLSLTHRTLCMRAMFNERYSPEQVAKLLDEFRTKIWLGCENSMNDGFLVSRVLYSPEVKPLWLDKEVKNIVETPVSAMEAHTTSITATTPPPSLPQGKIRSMSMNMHSDMYAKVDLLNYESYATVLARMITSGLSQPPLNIGIMAPWGKGKTTLMRFIAQKISQTRAERDRFSEEQMGSRTVKEWPDVSLWDLFSWLDKKGENLFTPKKLSYPVVWFNAWKFQKDEQIWAGLAHEIITQLAEQLPSLEREKFWLRLNIKRIDREKLKREIFFKAIQKSWFPILSTLVSFIFGILNHLYDWLPLPPGGMVSFAWIPLFFSGIWLTVTQVFKWKSPPEVEIGKYVLQPEYKSKMGYYSAVEEDLRHALELLGKPKEPPVIFIDDLDRCSPTTVAAVVEAINLFISGDMADCYFVLGQDAQIVAAALDVAYDNVSKKTVNMEKHHGSIGWYFMEKFIQLQLHIPSLTTEQSGDVLHHLFAIQDDETILDENLRAQVLKDYDQFEQHILKDPDLELSLAETGRKVLEAKLLLFDPKRIQGFQERVIDRVIANCEVDDNELRNMVTWAAPYLNNSLREIKRFANLFTFYNILKYTSSGENLLQYESEVLGKWILIMIRWPQLVRAIQWDTEKSMLQGTTPMDRVTDFEKLIKDCADQLQWETKLRTRIIAPQELTWQVDIQFLEFFKNNIDDTCNLIKAVSCGLW